MAAPTNTATTLVQKGNREDLNNVISLVAPEETPFTSNIGSKGKAKAVKHEWQTQALRTPTSTNAALEADDAGDYKRANTKRVGNYTQIVEDAFVVGGTQEEVDKAGKTSEINFQSVTLGLELKRDWEASCLSANPSRNESGSDARLSAGVQSWIETNIDLGATGTAGGYNTSTGIVDAPSDGTARAFSETQLKGVMQSIFEQSGGRKRRNLYTSAKHKVQFSAFTGISETRTQVSGNKQAVIHGAADVYVSDFGELVTVPLAYGLDSTALIIDHEYLGVANLRGWSRTKLAKTGDNEKYQILAEKTLVCENEKAHGMIRDLS